MEVIASQALDVICALLGPDAVLTEAADTAGFVTPWRGPRGEASAVVLPSDTAQVRSVMGWARHHGIRLVPQGANTGLVGASTPPPGSDAVVLSTNRLRSPLCIDPVDRTAVVAAGIRLSEVNQAASAHGLHLPVDLGADPSLGGMAATNTGGARTLRYGDMRRHVLGLRAVLADEGCTLVDELWTLRKHNVGPSIGQLLIGAGGAYAVITEVAVDLQPIPQERACAWLAPRSAEDVITMLVHAERECTGLLSAFEVASANALDAACSLESVRASPFRGDASPPHSVLVELDGRAGVAEELLALLAGMDSEGLVREAVVLPPADAWAVRHGMSEGLARRGTVIGLDVSVPRSTIPTFLNRVAEGLGAGHPEAQLCDFGHWGDGGVHCNVLFPREADDAPVTDETLATVRDLVLDLVESFGGSFSAEHGIGPWNAERWTRSVSSGTRTLLQAIADRADPLGILGHPGLPYAAGQATGADRRIGMDDRPGLDQTAGLDRPSASGRPD